MWPSAENMFHRDIIERIVCCSLRSLLFKSIESFHKSCCQQHMNRSASSTKSYHHCSYQQCNIAIYIHASEDCFPWIRCRFVSEMTVAPSKRCLTDLGAASLYINKGVDGAISLELTKHLNLKAPFSMTTSVMLACSSVPVSVTSQ